MIDEGSTKCGRGCDRIMFKVPVLKQSLPKVTIFVFALVNTPQDEKVHAQGKIDVTFDELSENYVSKNSLGIHYIKKFLCRFQWRCQKIQLNLELPSKW